MKKHENAIKMLMKNAVDCSYYGYYESENGARYLTNGHLIIKLFNTYSTVTTDFVGDLPHLKPLNNIPTFQERFKTDFKQRNNARVYKHRVSNLKALKNDYMTFNNPVSCYNDKYAIGGKVAAGNTS